MSHKSYNYCLHCSLLIVFMLLFQVCSAQYDFKKVDDWLSGHLNDLGGRAVLLVQKDGKMVYAVSKNKVSRKQKMAGKYIARKTGKDPKKMVTALDADSKIAIASCSKWLSAALVMTFVDEGKLKLTDTVGKYLPVLGLHGKGKISISDCLSQQTGIDPGNLKESLEITKTAKTMEEAVAAIALLPVEAEPGTSFHYSNVGLQIAAAVLEKISNKSFETLFRERIALPCNMLHTDFGHKPVPLAAGGAFSTANDYLSFLQMILAKGIFNGQKVLSAESVARMQENNIAGKKLMYAPAEAGNWGYGYGEWLMSASTPGYLSQAVTSPGLFGSFPWVDNKLGYAATLFTFNLNRKGRNERYTALKKLVDDAITIY